jgi:hypothetical protein
MTER